MIVFGKLEISEQEADEMSDAAVVRRLVASGVSQLSAERIVEVERSTDEPSRARRRPMSRH